METIKTDLRDMKVRIVCDCPEDKEAKCVIASVGSKTEEFAGGVRRRVTITAENFAACTMNLRVRAAVMYDGRAFGDDDAFFAAGYQSWTTAREYTRKDRQKGLRLPIRALSFIPIVKKCAGASGDYSFTPYRRGVFHSVGYTYLRKLGSAEHEFFGSLSEDEAFTIFVFDAKKGVFSIVKDVEGMEIPVPGKSKASVVLFDIISFTGDRSKVFESYAKAFRMVNAEKDEKEGGQADPGLEKLKKEGTLPEGSVYIRGRGAVEVPEKLAGYTSWYNYFANIDASTIRRDLDGLISATKGLQVAKDSEIFQIDDGWQTAVGDWEIDAVKFPKPAKDKGGLAAIVDEVHAAGMKAGLWLAPFCVGSDAEVLRKNPEWILKTRKGGKRKAIAGFNGWGGPLDPFYAFDLENEEVCDHIKGVFKKVWEWGFDLVKLDFLYAACMFPRGGKTRGRLMHEAMKFLREECLDDKKINGGGQKLLLGCGVPIVSALGYVEACRIGCDVDLTYKPRFYGKCTNEEIVSAENAMNNTIWRSHLDGNFFLADPDVFFLRGEKAPERTEAAQDIAKKGKKYRAVGEGKGVIFTNGEKDMLRKINSTFGSVLFVSDNAGESGYDTEALREAYTENPRRDIKVIERTSRDVIEVTFGNGDKATADFAQGKFEIAMAADAAKGTSSEPASPETQKKA
ncbi:MAG TPA: alpha-galactosidase [Candidatus Limadaptatus stercoripullorum]|uniref:Alpha-galactosidase n=1 Tax=Candidatus Limadaptatus stercoripullorum TaxID=2840846 RepID=A0A9D1N9N5_9FIRM|nr:alpha-galactosidase [Candidatus Limadaptatus stercoripullorum]